MELKELSYENSYEEYLFFKNNLKNEMGFINEYKDFSYDEYKTIAIPERLNSKKGINLKENYVSDTYYFLYNNNKIIGLFKLRHYLNETLKNGSGHIGYLINKEYRHKGYATNGLKLLIELIKKEKLIKEDELYFECFNTNIASIKTILKNNGYIHHYSDNNVYLRIRLDDLNLNTIPLVEYDENKEVFFAEEANDLIFTNKSKLIICYFKEKLEELIFNNEIELYYIMNDTMTIRLYKDRKTPDLYYLEGLVGEPLIGGYLDLFIRHGLTKILFIGGAGALIKTNPGDIFIIKEAIRDEGFSYHYLKPSRYVLADEKIIKFLESELNKQNIKYQLAKTWTIDAIYRETKRKIDLRKKEGAMLVEMEQAGLIALTKFYNVNYGALIYAGDDLSSENHDLRAWKSIDIRKELLNLARQIIIKM